MHHPTHRPHSESRRHLRIFPWGHQRVLIVTPLFDSSLSLSLHLIENWERNTNKVCIASISPPPTRIVVRAAELSAKKERKECRRKLFSTQSLLTTQYIVCRINSLESLVCASWLGECVQPSFLQRGTFAIFCARCSTAARVDVNELFTSPRVLSFSLFSHQIRTARKFSRVLQRESSFAWENVYIRGRKKFWVVFGDRLTAVWFANGVWRVQIDSQRKRAQQSVKLIWLSN